MSLPLSPIVNVVVRVSPMARAASNLDTGLLVGSSAVIPKTERVRKYSSIAAITADGFAANSPEVKAATLYFGATPRPAAVYIGVWDKTGSETAVEAVQACRAVNADWYAVTVLDTAEADIVAIAAYVETAGVENPMVYMYTTADDVVRSGEGVFKTLSQSSYRRSFGQYSKTPNAVCSIMGYAMGANTGAANSAYTLNLKPTPGVLPEALSESEYDAIRKNNGNVTVNRGGRYNILQEGTMAGGVFFDEIIGIDLTAIQIQNAVMNLLTSTSKVPQTENGVSRIMAVIVPPCETAVRRGFIAPGQWRGDPILDLALGDTLPTGYLIQSEPIDNQSQTDREARKMPPIYVALKLAGAIHSASIMVDVNR